MSGSMWAVTPKDLQNMDGRWKAVIHDSEDPSMHMIKGRMTGHRALEFSAGKMVQSLVMNQDCVGILPASVSQRLGR